MQRRLAVSLLALFVPAVAPAQKQEGEPKRPPLHAAADTNEAQVYYDFGHAKLRDNPKVAADAFYWATRLNPARADAFYARRVALLLTDDDRLARYWRADRSMLRSAEIKRIDSLYLQALTLNPFFYEGLERRLQDAVIAFHIKRDAAISGSSMNEMQYHIQNYLSRAGPGEKAFRAYTDGRFDDALREYAAAIKAARAKHYYRTMRGRLFFQIGEVDSALAELTLAVEEMRKKEDKDLVYVYQSKALLEQAIGMAHERRGDRNAARDAYGRALQEDLAYSPAHTQLAFLALDTKDTTTAVSEFDLAVQLRPDDSALRYQYGYVLAETERFAEAEEHLKKAMALNPVYALPHHALARLYERQRRAAEAAAAYKTFVSMASQRDPRRAEAMQRLAALEAK